MVAKANAVDAACLFDYRAFRCGLRRWGRFYQWSPGAGTRFLCQQGSLSERGVHFGARSADHFLEDPRRLWHWAAAVQERKWDQ